jgi:glycosyltransferase involved in cell wall biosynthesis
MAIQRIHRQQPFDVLHALWVEEPALIATLARRWFNIPVVLSLMGGELVGLPDIKYGYQLGRLMRGLIDFCLKHAPFITVGSDQLRQKVPSTYQAKTHRIPLGVDWRLFNLPPPHFQKHPRFTGQYNLVHAASLSPIKNQAMLFTAVALARKSLDDLQLHIVGTGVLEAELRQLATDLNLDVVWHGQVAHHALPLYYQSADLAVLTSFFESQSMVALEAGACGTLTIGTTVGLLPELLERAPADST